MEKWEIENENVKWKMKNENELLRNGKMENDLLRSCSHSIV